jgi:hypothetical protein
MPRSAASLAHGFARAWFYTGFVHFSILETPRQSFFTEFARQRAMIVPKGKRIANGRPGNIR